jgi:hypothetical protein
MGVCPRHARRILIGIHRQNPDKGLLVRPSGAPEGRFEVDPYAFRDIVLRRRGLTVDADTVGERLAFCESDIGALRVQVRKLKTRQMQLETGRIDAS